MKKLDANPELKDNKGLFTEREKAIDLYGRELVESIERGEEDIKAGRVTRIKDINNIWDSIMDT